MSGHFSEWSGRKEEPAYSGGCSITDAYYECAGIVLNWIPDKLTYYCRVKLWWLRHTWSIAHHREYWAWGHLLSYFWERMMCGSYQAVRLCLLCRGSQAICGQIRSTGRQVYLHWVFFWAVRLNGGPLWAWMSPSQNLNHFMVRKLYSWGAEPGRRCSHPDR